jgi:LacI family transcriptional regulator
VVYVAGIRDVAREANVSIATVSRVINGSDKVSEETRKKVLRAMRKLNFRPKPYFGNNEVFFKTIGVLVPDIRGYHYSDIVMAIESCAFENGFDVILSIPKADIDNEKHILEKYFKRKIDGIIVAELLGGENYIEKFLKSGIPLVVLDFSVEEINFDVVNVDNMMGAYNAIKYLYENGHRKILFIPGPEWSPAANEREKGVKRFLESVDDLEIYYTNIRGYNSQDGKDAIFEYLTKNSLNFTAIFAVNDWTAIGAIDALRIKGIKVPDDVSIIGFDDAPFLDYIEPKLTTVRQPRWELGYTAAQILIERITSKRSRLPRNVVIPPELVIRESIKKIE